MNLKSFSTRVSGRCVSNNNQNTRKILRQVLQVSSILTLVLQMSATARAETLTLQQAVSEAFDHSPQIERSSSEVKEASWKKVESYSGFLPTISFSASYLTEHKYMFEDINSAMFGPNTISFPEIIPTSDMTFNAEWSFFDGFASTHRLQGAKAMERSAEKDHDWVKFQVEREVTLQYYRALGAKVLRDVAEKNLATLKDHLRDAQLSKKAGISTNYDILRVEVQVSEAQTELLNAEDNIILARNRLTELMGREVDDREITGQLPILKPEIVQSLTADSINDRKDLASMKEKVTALGYQESANAVYLVPRLSFFGQYDYYNNRNDEFNDFKNYRDDYGLGIRLTWNIFDGMTSIARSKESIEQKYQTEKTLRIAELKAKTDFDLYKRRYVYNCSIYSYRVDDVQRSTESVRLAREGRRVGARTSTDLLDAEFELHRAQAGVVNAQVGAVEALINLELSTGQELYTFN